MPHREGNAAMNQWTPGMEIQDFTLRWYAVSPWDISSLQRSHEHQMIRPSC